LLLIATSGSSAQTTLALHDALAQLQAGVATRGPAVLEVKLNGQPRGQAWALIDRTAGVLIDKSALQRWGVHTTGLAARDEDGRTYVPIGEIQGARATIDEKKQEIALWLPPETFTPSEHAIRDDAEVLLSPPPWALFANYSLFGYRDRETSYASGLLEAGVPGPYGVGIASVAANTVGIEGTTHQVVRLDTYWRYDEPDQTRTYVIGDSFTLPSSWGTAVRFAGFQVASNFSLQPNLVTYPLQAVSGTAVVPSTVDVLVNGSRVGSQQVDAGPFTLTNVPVVTGTGEVQVIVRDAFGQQQVLTQSFYSSPRLLRAGLSEYSVSAGLMRQNYGLDSFDYEGGLASAYWRHGVTDQVTVETLGNATSSILNGGAVVGVGIGQWGTVSAGLVGSNGDAGRGQMWLAGYEYFTPRYNFSIKTAHASDNFRQVADIDIAQIERLTYAAAGVNMGRAGSLGLGYLSQRYQNEPSTESGTVSYTVSLGRAFLVLSGSRTFSPATATSAFATLMLPLDPLTTGSVDVQRTRADSRTSSVSGATLQRSVPLDTGWGYRLRATTDGLYEGGLSYASPYGNYTFEAARLGDETAARALVTGGVGWIGGTTFASKTISESFGLAQVGDRAGIPVYHEGNLVAHTDEHGRAILPKLYAYMPNRIGIDDRTLPIDATVAGSERRVTPFYRSGVLVDFDVRRGKDALVEVRLPNGDPLPTGAEATSEGRSILVGRGGLLFVENVHEGQAFTVRSAGKTCAFQLTGRIPDEVLPRVGPFVCQ
jgi:outer membrane usher protein